MRHELRQQVVRQENMKVSIANLNLYSVAVYLCAYAYICIIIWYTV